MAKKKTVKSDYSTARVGDALFKALTQQEIVHLLDVLLKALSPELRAQVLTQLEPDTRQTVAQILSPPKPLGGRKVAGAEPVSTAKLRQTWSGLWNEWDKIVEEAAQEKGKYINQEASWEAPYFNATMFVENLEKVAKKMCPLIRIAFQDGFSPNAGFAQAVQNATEDVSDELPEWLEVTDGFYLDATLTTCLLEWEWLKGQKEGEDGFAFAQCILDWENEVGNVGLDDDAFLGFFTQLPEADQELVYQGMTESKEMTDWSNHLKNTYSHWHALYMYYAESRAPEEYLDNLLATVSQHWQNGLPVVESLLNQKDYERGLQAIGQTLEALLQHHRGGQSWTPDTALLFPIVSGHYHNDNSADVKTLLHHYQQAVDGLGQSQQVEVLEIQRAVFDHFFDWEWMLKTFGEASVSKKVRLALFQSWRDYIARKYDSWWLEWLIESHFDIKKGSPWFQKKIDQWLVQLPNEMRLSDANFGCLRLLTWDLMEISGRRKDPYDAFFKVVIEPQKLTTPDGKFRQKYLDAYVPAGILDRVMRYWKEHLQILVPNPQHVHKADYTEHAQWMAVLKEMAPISYRALLKEWRVTHERRKNLWQAMEMMGLE
jgi:hypothetical protein